MEDFYIVGVLQIAMHLYHYINVKNTSLYPGWKSMESPYTGPLTGLPLEKVRLKLLKELLPMWTELPLPVKIWDLPIEFPISIAMFSDDLRIIQWL